MTILSGYLRIWRQSLATEKQRRQSSILTAEMQLQQFTAFCTVPTYLGVKLDRSVTFRHHIETLHKKLKSWVVLLRRLAGSGWGTDAKTLRIAALSWCTLHLSTAH